MPQSPSIYHGALYGLQPYTAEDWEFMFALWGSEVSWRARSDTPYPGRGVWLVSKDFSPLCVFDVHSYAIQSIIFEPIGLDEYARQLVLYLELQAQKRQIGNDPKYYDYACIGGIRDEVQRIVGIIERKRPHILLSPVVTQDPTKLLRGGMTQEEWEAEIVKSPHPGQSLDQAEEAQLE